MSNDISKIPCLYCGEKTESRGFIVNPKAKEELPCCSGNCLSEARRFIEWDSHNRIKLYGILFASVVINLFFIGFNWNSRFRYIPLLTIATSVYFYPLVFTRYIMYQRLGIKKTLKVIKCISLLIVAFSILLMVIN